MSRPEGSEQPTELDALLARPTPAPAPDQAVDADEQQASASESRPVRSRLEAWLRGGGGSSRDDLSTASSRIESVSVDGDGPAVDSTEIAGTEAARTEVESTEIDGVEVGQAEVGTAEVAGVAEAGSGSESPTQGGGGGATGIEQAGPGAAVGGLAAEGEIHGSGGADRGGASYELVSVGAIEANTYQPRRHFDEAGLAALTESVREVGVLQPVLVRPPVEGRYELVAGERRWRAARRAGLRMIPVIVRPTNDQGALENAIIENLHREDLNPLEEAAAYRQLADEFGLSQDAVAKRVGKSRPAVANAIRLLGLPTTVQRLVREGELSAGHARALLGLPEVASQLLVAKEALEQGWTVRQLEAEVRRRIEAGPDFGSVAGGGGSRGGDAGRKSTGVLEAETVLSDALQTRVEVVPSRRGGRVVVRYADADDLSRLVEQLRGSGEAVPED